MAKSHEIKVARRDVQGQGASRRLRHAGVVPGIVYGGDREPVKVQFNHNEIWLAQFNDWFYSSIIDLNLDGTIHKVLLRDMQRHPYKQLVMHLDFQRVNDNEVLHASVPLTFINEDTSPAGKSADVLVTHELKEVNIACLPKDLPQSIEVDLGELKAGDIIYLSGLKLPAGVEIPALKLGKNHDDAVVIAKTAGAEEASAE
ncbi:50S ribosomal protein L25/general stress protein Ctc [Stenotrophomonas sp. ATCM1_4]|uniref:Large ribosomal subunit protein bL25 n=1 Tax=Stenotrophomonas capsici TaxID=3110230 RepID=A0ABU5V1I1_9GAMM|nr:MULTISPECIES: 50S ribosomal protein L25/general stress protein Ctc [unclassified Stenotrophomonas]MEA5667210.1 50S ribosomal protein L25/general stress protein Ctc [Stenotrophomonas sp. MH1]TDB28450.1 50S ribosomal protein L25/general stress protein Ctc [Stenotrophomonas sp. ATCM1_4]